MGIPAISKATGRYRRQLMETALFLHEALEIKPRLLIQLPCNPVCTGLSEDVCLADDPYGDVHRFLFAQCRPREGRILFNQC